MELGDCEEIKWTELEKALTESCLKWVTIDDYVLVTNNKCDMMIGGEPYLALQVWLNIRSGKIIARIWDKTVSTGRVAGVSHFVEACKAHFKGKPCIGCPVNSEEFKNQDYLISQTPMTRKISLRCKGTLEPGTDEAISCPDCLKLSKLNSRTIAHHNGESHPDCNIVENEENIIKGAAYQAMYLREITRKYPQIIKDGKQFKIKIKTEDLDGSLSEELLLVDPTSTLQEGRVVQTISEIDFKHAETKKLLQNENETCSTEKYEVEMTEDLHKFTSVIDELGCMKSEYSDSYQSNIKEKPNDHHIKASNHTHDSNSNFARDRSNAQCTNENVQCEICKKYFYNRKALERHKAVHHGAVGPLHKNCEICGETILCRQKVYGRHMRSRHGIKGKIFKMQCHWCKETYSANAIAEHAMWKHLYGEFLCKYCSFSGHSVSDIIEHVNQNHEVDTSVTCPICKKDHLIKDLEDKYKQCVKQFLGKNQQICPSCGKTITTKLNLWNHLRHHCAQRERPKEKWERWCDKCGKSFSSKVGFRDHVKIVHENYVFKCEHCPLTFDSRGKKLKHVSITHSTDERYQCEFCGLRLGNMNAKKHHELKHQEPKFQCSFCEKKLKTERAKVAHERQHTGEKPFKCTLCETSFVSLNGLRQHKRGVHKVEGPNGGKLGWGAIKNKSKNKEHQMPPPS